MLCQYGTVAGDLIANQFPINQVGTVIGNYNMILDFRARQRGYVPYMRMVVLISLPPVSTKKTKGFFE